MFPYESTSNKFNIPHDLNILKEIFNIEDGKYIKETYKGLKENRKGLVLTNISQIYDLINKKLSNKDYLMVKGSNSTGLFRYSQLLKLNKSNAL